jgi:hypothetical protein
MADMIFSCPHCSKDMTCDEQWSGHTIQCPLCQKELVVPAKTSPKAASNKPLVPKPPAGGGKLAINQGYHAQQSAQLGQSGKPNIPIRNLAGGGQKKKNWTGILATLGLVVVLGGGGYFGYDYYVKKKEKAEAEAAAAAAEEAKAAQEKAAAEAAAKAAKAASFESKPIVAPKWSLDLGTVKIPDCKVNGTISSNNFVMETARVDPMPGVQILRFLQGQPVSPDREVMIHLRLKPGENLGGQQITITSDQKGPAIPQVSKRWKTAPQYAPTMKSFLFGYAMKLELGQVVDNVVQGKVYLALPDKEQTVIAGAFKANVTVVDPNAQPQVQAEPTPVADPSAERAREQFQRRYGTRR